MGESLDAAKKHAGAPSGFEKHHKKQLQRRRRHTTSCTNSNRHIRRMSAKRNSKASDEADGSTLTRRQPSTSSERKRQGTCGAKNKHCQCARKLQERKPSQPKNMLSSCPGCQDVLNRTPPIAPTLAQPVMLQHLPFLLLAVL